MIISFIFVLFTTYRLASLFVNHSLIRHIALVGQYHLLHILICMLRTERERESMSF